MSDATLVRCRTLDCKGTLGAFRSGAFYPSAHLIGGRDWYVHLLDTATVVCLRCSMCGTWHEMLCEVRQLAIRKAA